MITEISKVQQDEFARAAMAVWKDASINALRSGCDAKEAVHRADEVMMNFEHRFHGKSVMVPSASAETVIDLYGREGIIGKTVEVRASTDDNIGRLAKVMGFSAADNFCQERNLLCIDYLHKIDTDTPETWVMAKLCFVVVDLPKVTWKG